MHTVRDAFVPDRHRFPERGAVDLALLRDAEGLICKGRKTEKKTSLMLSAQSAQKIDKSSRVKVRTVTRRTPEFILLLLSHAALSGLRPSFPHSLSPFYQDFMELDTRFLPWPGRIPELKKGPDLKHETNFCTITNMETYLQTE